MNEQGGQLRIGDGERQAVLDSLISHREAGRLDPVEFEQRQVAASTATTWGEVAPLFADLPAPYPVGMPPTLLTSGGTPARLSGSTVATPTASPGGVDSNRVRDTVMALVPLLAVLLFFVTGSWLWFLAIPIMGILLYGPGGKPRDRNRDRRDR